MTEFPEKKQVVAILQRFLGSSRARALLFGSVASGKSTSRSDIDVAIVSDQPLDLATWAMLEAEFSNSDIARKVDLIDYQRVNASFKKVIDRDGQEIWRSHLV